MRSEFAWYTLRQIDFAITELLDDTTCLLWLGLLLKPTGLVCPCCHNTDRPLLPRHDYFIAAVPAHVNHQGTGLHTFLCTFRGVHKYYPGRHVATYKLITNAHRSDPTVIRRMCCGDHLHARIT